MSAKQKTEALPACFGIFRSPQSDAENCCQECPFDARCMAQRDAWRGASKQSITVPARLDDIIAAIAVRDSGSTRYPGQPVRWDSALAAEVIRLREELSRLAKNNTCAM